MNFNTPLRYPGGKSKISDFLEDIILLNNLEGCDIYELYAGGAGASINLLLRGICSNIIINDLDYHIYSFWRAILEHTDEFIGLIEESNVSLDNWNRQRQIYLNPEKFSQIEVGFSTFFLNRTNRSGILYRAGPIGGKTQTGNYKIDVRFNKVELIRRVERIAVFRKNITVQNKESITFLDEIVQNPNRKLLFLDPPYYNQGENLYLNNYQDNNHFELSMKLKNLNQVPWFLTYDNCKRIKELYADCKIGYLPMTYTLQEKRKSKEVMIFSENLFLPKTVRIGKKSSKLNLLEN